MLYLSYIVYFLDYIKDMPINSTQNSKLETLNMHKLAN